MKVLLVPELYPTHDNPVAGIFIDDQIKALKKFAEVVVLNVNPFYRGEYIKQPGVEYFDFHLYNKRPGTLLKPILYKFWERQAFKLSKKISKVDLVHLHGAALRGDIALNYAKANRVPLVCTEHTGPWSSISSRPHVFRRAKRILESANAVLPVSNHLKKEMVNSGLKMKRVEVLGNPVGMDLHTLRSSDLLSQKKILFVGRLDEFKGGLRTLKAFHKIIEDLPDWSLHIAGHGEEAPAIRNYIDSNSLNEAVYFQENVFSKEELSQLFHSSSFLVFPSRFESFGLIAAEAMATGLPVLCTNQTGPKDYCNSQNSISVNPDSIEDLAKGMLAMREKLDSFYPLKVRESIGEKYGIEKYGSKLKELYTELI